MIFAIAQKSFLSYFFATLTIMTHASQWQHFQVHQIFRLNTKT